MINRRMTLAGALMAVTGLPLAHKAVHAKASQPKTSISFDVPTNACDCHTHIHGDQTKFPYFADRVYTPEAALPDEMAQLHHALKIKRVVIVTPSVYGSDNAATLYGMAARGGDARGVAVINTKTTESELDAMASAGIVGIRLNLNTGGTNDPAIGRRLLEEGLDRIKGRGWHVQIYTNLAMISALKGVIAAAPAPIVLDHFGGAKASLGVEQPGFTDILDLVKSGNAYVKISGAYRSSNKGPDYADVTPLAKALIGANSQRILWGTDWPHPDSAAHPGRTRFDIAPFFDIDDGLLMNQLALWAPDAQERAKILVENPARLYRF